MPPNHWHQVTGGTNETRLYADSSTFGPPGMSWVDRGVGTMLEQGS